MRRQTRTLFLGSFAAVALAALGTLGWVMDSPRAAQAPAQESAGNETGADSANGSGAAGGGDSSAARPRLASGPEYDRCLAHLRSNPDAALTEAEAWEGRGGGDGAKHCQALALLALGQAELAAQRLESLASQSQASGAARASVFAQATQAWLMAGRASRAYGAATLALTLAPDDPELLIDRAVALGSQARYAEAIEDLDAALRLDPNRTEALVFRAAARRHRDLVDLAARDIERALELQPQNVEALLERGIIRQLRGDAGGARQDWEQAIRLAPNSATADLAAQNLALNEAGPARR